MSDKRDGDELFEDLDKFFAPIRDVDWEDDEAPAEQQPHEEHVEIVAGQAPDRTADEPVATESPDADQDDEDDWYDTGSVSVGDLFADEDVDEPPAAGEPVVLADEDPEGFEEDAAEEPQAPAATDQTDLFATPSAEAQDDETDDDDQSWATDDPKSVVVTSVGGSDEPFGADPTDEDIEAAAAHFSGSVRDETHFDTQPIRLDPDAFGGEMAAQDVEDDILADLEPLGGPRTVIVGSEGISGPSWQDVAAVEVGADVERRGPDVGERDVPAAFMTGVVLAVVGLGAIWLGPAAFAIVATAAVLVAQGELFGVMVKRHLQPATAIGLVGGALMMAAAYLKGEAAMPAMFALAVMATFAWFMTVPATHRKDVLKNISLTVFNMAWIPLLAGYLIATLNLPDGRALVIAVVGLTFAFDTVAFLAGSVWGGSFVQRSLAPTISPKKSVEGLVAGTLATIILAAALVPAFVTALHDQRNAALLLGLVVAVAATLGDLAESLVKRDLGIKDMGSVLPGHGGVLDRIDSLLFVAPAAFLLFRVIL